MTIRFSTLKRGLLFFLWGCLIWSGCSAILPQSNYIWSENYALDTNGGHCSSPEMNDGNLKTFGRLGLHATGQMDSAITRIDILPHPKGWGLLSVTPSGVELCYQQS